MKSQRCEDAGNWRNLLKPASRGAPVKMKKIQLASVANFQRRTVGLLLYGPRFADREGVGVRLRETRRVRRGRMKEITKDAQKS